MRKSCFVASLLVCMLSAPVLRADDMGLNFRLGLSYISGFQDIIDLYEDDLNEQGYYTDSSGNPGIGLQFNTHYNWTHGSRVDFTLGPVAAIIGDATYYDAPFSLTYGFNLPPTGPVAFYGRAGVAVHIVGGDLDPESDPGFVGYLGMEFLRTKVVGFGFEVGFDTSEVSFKTSNGRTELEAHDLVVSVFARF